MSCNELDLRNATDKCAYVVGRCHGESIVNLYEVYFCTLNMNNYIAVPLAVIFFALPSKSKLTN